MNYLAKENRCFGLSCAKTDARCFERCMEEKESYEGLSWEMPSSLHAVWGTMPSLREIESGEKPRGGGQRSGLYSELVEF